MTRLDGEHLSDRITLEERRRLYGLINEHRDIDLRLNKAKAELKFEQAKEKLVAFRENREIRQTEKEAELEVEIRSVKEEWDDKIAIIGDLVEDLGLLGVNL